MPKIRTGRGLTKNTHPPEYSSTTLERLSYGSDGTTELQELLQAFPDVPMNPQHRFCTPPPLDPRFVDPPPAEKDDFPQFTSRPPSPDDFDELTGARPPLPPRPGSQGNPIVVEDDASQHMRKTATEAAPRRRTTGALRPIPSTTQHPSPSPATEAPRGASRKPKSKAAQPMKNNKVLQKVAAHGYSPTKSSPLSQVAYRAPSEMPASPNLLPQLR